MKKILCALLLLFVPALALAASWDQPQYLVAAAGSQVIFKNVEYQVADIDGSAFNWKSSDPRIASVSEDGIIVGLQKGECTITGTVKNDASFIQLDLVLPDYVYSDDLFTLDSPDGADLYIQMIGSQVHFQGARTNSDAFSAETFPHESIPDLYTVHLTPLKPGSGKLYYTINNTASFIEVSVTENAFDPREKSQTLAVTDARPTSEPVRQQVSVSNVNLSEMTFQDLIALKDRLNLAIWESADWQEVTVPTGLWEIGKDIPAGIYTVRPVDRGFAHFYYGSVLTENDTHVSTYSPDYRYESIISPTSDIYPNLMGETSTDVNMQDGAFLQVMDCDVILSPYSGKRAFQFSAVPSLPESVPFDYKKLARNPENFFGKVSTISGRVVQVLGSRSEGYQLRLDTSGKGDTMYLVMDQITLPDFNILEGDSITADVMLLGEFTYRSVLGESITIPLAHVRSFKLN